MGNCYILLDFLYYIKNRLLILPLVALILTSFQLNREIEIITRRIPPRDTQKRSSISLGLCLYEILTWLSLSDLPMLCIPGALGFYLYVNYN